MSKIIKFLLILTLIASLNTLNSSLRLLDKNSELTSKAKNYPIVGGFSEGKEADSRAEKVFESVKPAILNHLNISNGNFKIISYETQVVAGIN